MTRQVNFPVLVRQSLPGGGVMISATERELCISVVSVDLFQITGFAHGRVRFWPRLLPERLSPYLDILPRPIFSCLIVLFCHMLTLLFQGLALGGVWGVREGARRPLAVSNTRLRINSVLNSVTRRGTFIGNSAGVLGPSTFFTRWYLD